MSFAWAESYPELYKICVLFDRNDLLFPIKWCYKPMPVCLQNGPQCGLVALAMLKGTAETTDIDEIFTYARKKRFTNKGEIFSANYMFQLAKQFLQNKYVEMYRGSLEDEKIKNFLLAGGCLLVPYDTRKDNSPGLLRGHNSHWCAVSGAIDTGVEFFVTARHGKVRNVAIWKLSDLAASNEQLFEYVDKGNLDEERLVMPLDGIAGKLGLNCQSILISENNS